MGDRDHLDAAELPARNGLGDVHIVRDGMTAWIAAGRGPCRGPVIAGMTAMRIPLMLYA